MVYIWACWHRYAKALRTGQIGVRKRGSKEQSMPNRTAYDRRWTTHSAWVLRAILLILAGATTVFVALAITKNVSVKSDSARNGKVVGVRHDAAAVPPTGQLQSNVSTAASNQEKEPHTVVRNGITVISPELLVPVIDIPSLETASG